MASRYWVGGTANWDGTAGVKWAATSGGTGGAGVPTSADDVFFDANSGSGTITISATAACDNLDCSGFSGTLDGTSSLSVFGNLTLGAAMTFPFSGGLGFNATSTGKTITTNGVAFNTVVDFNGSGGSWVLQDNFTNNRIHPSNLLTQGTLDTNGKTLNILSFVSNGASSRTLTLGASTINVSAAWMVSSSLTLNAGTSQINITTGGSIGHDFGSLTYYNLTLSPSVPSATSFAGNNTFNNLTFSPSAFGNGPLSLAGSLTVTGTLTSVAPSVSNRVTIQSDTVGTSRTISAGGTALTDVDFVDIVGAGSAAPFHRTRQFSIQTHFPPMVRRLQSAPSDCLQLIFQPLIRPVSL